MTAAEKQRANAIENILSYMALADLWEPPALRDWPQEIIKANSFPIGEFDGAYALDLADDSTEFFSPDYDPIELVRTMGEELDVSIINSKFSTSKTWYQQSPGRFLLKRFRRMNLREARPLGLRLTTGELYMHSQAVIHADGAYSCTREVWERRGERLYCIGVPYGMHRYQWQGGTPEPDEKEASQFFMGASVALTLDYEWLVEMRPNRLSPSICVPCSVRGVGEYYKSRNIAPGKSRRDALRHWVQTHSRRVSSADDDATVIQVLGYLRGQTDFTWNGFECRIHVSNYDLRRLEALNYERETLRALRKAKRKKFNRMHGVRTAARRRR